MPEITVNGERVHVADGTTVAAALLTRGAAFRHSVTGEPRAAFCGMGTCFECRAEVDGAPHERTCQIVCREGMQVRTS